MIRNDNESVFVIRVDHGQAIVECVNAGEMFSPPGGAALAAKAHFEEHLVQAAMVWLTAGDCREPADDILFTARARLGPPLNSDLTANG